MRPTRSFGSVKIISLDRARLLEALHQIATRLRAERSEVEEVRLFGSLARQDHTGASDADVLIVLSGTPELDPARRSLAYLPYFDLPVGTDLLVFTRAEIEACLSAGDPFWCRLWRDSVAL